MSEPIKVGDLVMVVRWPHDCINPKAVIGTPFRVSQIRPTRGFCNRCRRTIDASSFAAAGFDGNAVIPLNWLKRIDPTAELEGEKREEGIIVWCWPSTAPAARHIAMRLEGS